MSITPFVHYPLTEQHLVTILDQDNWLQSTETGRDDEGQAIYRTGFLVSVASAKAHGGKVGLQVTLRVADADRASIPTMRRNDLIEGYAKTVRAAGLTCEIEAPNGWDYPTLLWVPIQDAPASLTPDPEADVWAEPVVWADYPLDDVVSTMRPQAVTVRAVASAIQRLIDTITTYGKPESAWPISGLLLELRAAPDILRAKARIRSADQRRKELLSLYAHAREVMTQREDVLAAIDQYLTTGQDTSAHNVVLMARLSHAMIEEYRAQVEGKFVGLETVATHLHHLLGIMTRAQVAADDAAYATEATNTTSDPQG